MIASTEKKKRALKLRIKGQSYNEINSTLGIPKSTLSGGLKTWYLLKKREHV
ncbi:MAG: hypothetical protein JKX80_01195 [Candidatus Pacebacteria bacterium]|nr:hypothetical protein [Candidatus Paceibacterota bacterium]